MANKQIVPDTALARWLLRMIGNDVQYCLFSNDVIPELSFNAEAYIEVEASAESSFAYGWFLLDQAGELLLVQRFDGSPIEFDDTLGYERITVSPGSWSPGVVLLHKGITTAPEITFATNPPVPLQPLIGNNSRFVTSS